MADILDWIRSKQLKAIAEGEQMFPEGVKAAERFAEANKTAKRMTDITLGQAAQIPTDIASAPTALYSLLNMAANYASQGDPLAKVEHVARPLLMLQTLGQGKNPFSLPPSRPDPVDYSKEVLPGAKGAMEITNKINRVGADIGAAFTGDPNSAVRDVIEREAGVRPTSPTDMALVHPSGADPGEDIAQRLGSVLRIGGGLIPAPKSVSAAYTAALDKINTGSKVLDSITKGTAYALEAATPFVLKPSPGVIGANAAIGTGLVAGVEALTHDPNKSNISTGLERILSDDPQVEQATTQVNEETAQANAQAKDIKNRTFVRAGFLPFDDWRDNAKAAGAIGGATLAIVLLRRGLRGASETLKPSTTLDAVISDRLAPLRATTEMVNPSSAKHFDAFSARHGVDGSVSTAAEHWADSGKLPDAQISSVGPIRPLSTTSHREFAERYRALGPKGELFNQHVNNATELDNRIDNLINMKRSDGSMPFKAVERYVKYKNPHTGEWEYDIPHLDRVIRLAATDPDIDKAISVNMSGLGGGTAKSTLDLWNEMRAAIADPDISNLYKLHQNDMRTFTRYIENMGLRSKDEAEKFRKTNIGYAPTERDYGTNLWERTRTAGSGRDEGVNYRGFTGMGDPLINRARYAETVIRQAMKENTRRYWMKNMWDAKSKGHPIADKLINRRITEVDSYVETGGKIRIRHKNGTTNEYNANETVVWRDDNGKLYADAISDPMVLAALKMESPYMTNQVMHMWDWARRWQQLKQTGAVSLLGVPASPILALMTAFAGAVKKPSHIKLGLFDRAAKAINPNFHVPGDITNIAEAGYAIIADTASQLAKLTYQGMEASIIRDGVLSKMFGPGASRTIADTAKGLWEGSIRYKMLESNISHAAPLGDHVNYSAFVQNNAKKLINFGAAGDAVKKVFSVLDQVHNIVAASPISAMVRANINKMPIDELSKAGREFASDPGKRALAPSSFSSTGGTSLSHALHAANTSIPYLNVTIQAMADFMREFKKNPVRMTIGTTIAVGMPTFMEASYNIGLGPEYVEYMYNGRTPAQQARSFYFGVPGLPPEQGIEYNIDPFYRPFKVAAATMVGAMYGLFDGSIFKDNNDHVKMRLQDIAWPRFREAMNEAGEMSIGMQLPLPAELYIAGQGQIPGNISPNIANIVSGQGPALKPFARSPQEHRIAGFDDQRTSRYVNDNIFGLQLDRTFDETSRVILGTIGDRIFDSLRTFTRTGQEGGKTSEAIDDIAQREGMRLRDGMKMFNGLLWNQSPRISPYGVESKELSAKRKGMSELNKAMTEMKRYGESGTHTRPGGPLQGAMPSMPQDPQILQIAKEVAIFDRHLNRAFMSPMKAIQDKIVSLESTAMYSPKKQRDLINEQNRLLQEYQAAALQNVSFFEANLSQRLGRKIDLSRIDLDRGVDQFEPLATSQR